MLLARAGCDRRPSWPCRGGLRDDLAIEVEASLQVFGVRTEAGEERTHVSDEVAVRVVLQVDDVVAQRAAMRASQIGLGQRRKRRHGLA